jgi:hypothetical protein
MGREFASFIAERNSRFARPLFESATAPERHAIVNELGFRLFANAVPDPVSSLTEDRTESVRKAVERYFEDLAPNADNTTTAADLAEATLLAERIEHFLGDQYADQGVEVFPSFNGCGVLDRCYGDLLVGNTLLEVKSGAKSFQLDDLRQLIIYAALDSASNEARVSRLGLLNPRMGLSVTFTPEEVIMSTGRPPQELYSEVIEFVSAHGTSR